MFYGGLDFGFLHFWWRVLGGKTAAVFRNEIRLNFSAMLRMSSVLAFCRYVAVRCSDRSA